MRTPDYEDYAIDCLNDCKWPMLNDCPEWCSRHGSSGNHGKHTVIKERAMHMILKGKPESLIASICGVQQLTVRRWAKELDQMMEDPDENN